MARKKPEDAKAETNGTQDETAPPVSGEHREKVVTAEMNGKPKADPFTPPDGFTADDAFRALKDLAVQRGRVREVRAELAELKEMYGDKKKELETERGKLEGLAGAFDSWRKEAERQPLLAKAEEKAAEDAEIFPDDPADISIEFLGLPMPLQDVVRDKLKIKTIGALDVIIQGGKCKSLTPSERGEIERRIDQFFTVWDGVKIEGAGRHAEAMKRWEAKVKEFAEGRELEPAPA